MTQDADYVADDERFEPLSGDDLERIEEAGAEESEIFALAQTASFYRQEFMDMRDRADRLNVALKEAARALESAGFQFSADKAWAARNDGDDNG